ncbi:Di-sulfide bridge nucleocytoplasmic transport domain-domain-containing protein [Coniella lustricola]|uniref:Di-sulfide bridge nucleocytoplasmic transport domain-domain-containing protein n=1 Tax=Coniella lustricola TaxID=2025994 RepID=A0A2T3A7S9_9PEZI|nr:Di-sulfide bridge nucleocytoplasmic transport domain-domain-containing protein [Coniella lustricola]
MEKRGDVGHMDWDWENGRGNLDPTSPFTHQAQSNRADNPHNPFQAAASGSTPFFPANFNAAPRQSSPLSQSMVAAPSRDLFDPSLQRTSTAPVFRTTKFTDPTKYKEASFLTPHNEQSEMDFDDTTIMTEVSEMEVPDSPEINRSEYVDSPDLRSPETPARMTASARRSGKGPIARSTTLEWPVDRVRKRPRNNRDRDIGSTRKRLPGGCDEDDSDYDTFADGQRRRRAAPEHMGWLYYILSTISSNPEAPIIFSWYLQVFINAFFGGLLLWIAWGIISAVRGEVIYSSEKAKLNLLAEIEHCSKQYVANRCSPIADRIPAVEGLCNEWDHCMSQDPNSVAGVKASVSHLADIVNEFTTRLSWKSICVILLFAVVLVFANNLVFSKFRQNVRHYNQHQPGEPQHARQSGMGFPMTPHKPDQAYIFAPIGQTPKSLRRAFLHDDTDTDASPASRLLLPPYTPSRRSRSRGERSRSPSKRSPYKDW